LIADTATVSTENDAEELVQGVENALQDTEKEVALGITITSELTEVTLLRDRGGSTELEKGESDGKKGDLHGDSDWVRGGCGQELSKYESQRNMCVSKDKNKQKLRSLS